MPSSNKTPNAGLNVWIPTDHITTEDLNRDNQITDNIVGAMTHVPYVGSNGNWYIWNVSTGAYADSGYTAQGLQGVQGETGPQGAKGEQGPAGADGTSFIVLGLYATLTDLQAAHPTGDDGDAYAVGTSADNTVYIWDVDTGSWVDIGALQGPQGEQGPAGQDGADGLTVSVNNVTQVDGNIAIDADNIPESSTRKYVTPAQIAAIETIGSKADKSTIADYTLLAVNWSGTSAPYTLTLEVTGVTATSPVEVFPALAITDSQLTQFQSANIQDGGQSTGQIVLKAMGDKPTTDMPIRVIVRGDL